MAIARSENMDQMSNNPNTVDSSGRSIYGSQGYAFQRFQPNDEGGQDSVGDEGFTDVGYQVGDLQANPRLAAYLQNRGIMPQYDPQYGFVIPNEVNPGQVMTDYVRSIGAGDTPRGGVTGFLDRYAVPLLMGATGAGMAGGFGGAAAEAGAAGAAGSGAVASPYVSSLAPMGTPLGVGAAGVGAAGAAGAAGAGAAGGAAAGAAGAGAAGGLASWMMPAAILGSSLLGVGAAKSAADTQAEAQDRANALGYKMYEQGRQDLAPYAGAGLTAQNKLLTYLGLPGGAQGADFGRYAGDFSSTDFLANRDPGYGFRMSEGMKGLERSAAARGGLLSGATLKGAQRFGQDLASTEYQNAFNRYQTNRANALGPLDVMRASGQSAAAGQAGIAGNYGVRGAEGQTALGNIGAAGTMGQANALASGLGQYLNYSSNADLSNAIRTSAYGRPVTNALGS
jgi:hypothetical protein